MNENKNNTIGPSRGSRASSAYNKSDNTSSGDNFSIKAPSISLPKGGGAIKGIDQKFSVNAVNGTAGFSVPLPFSSARGYTPALSLNYNSGTGNGLFGMGWQMAIPSIKRKTDKELPRYLDGNDSDTFLISNAEDLVPEYEKDNAGNFIKKPDGSYLVHEFDSPDNNYIIRRYRPRIEGLFARIERWLHKTTGIIHWRVITKDNVTTVYGQSPKSFIADPKHPTHIFEWLIDYTYDDKGNCCTYQYELENQKGMPADASHNRNRLNGNAPFTNTYLKRIYHGNITMYKKHGDPLPLPGNYMFETVFDYGDHNNTVPFAAVGDWTCRPDAFSDYRAGFEIRTNRLCKRILFYHRFAELPEGSALVKALHLQYDNNGADGFTFLRDLTITGYTKHDDGSYTEKAMPPLSFEYSKHQWNETVKNVTTENLMHAPAGLNEPQYQFTDLYNEGLSGILTEQADGWFYKSNWGNGRFTAAKPVMNKPSYKGLSNGVLQLTDLESNGIKQLVHLDDADAGFFELDSNEKWQPYQPFKSIPNVDFKSNQTKQIDLDGDGQAEVLVTDNNAFLWYPSKGKKGYDPAQRTHPFFDEEKGPAIVFADAAQTIFLADMSGDGLTDLVRIKNGEVCYWPNMGYGKFGAKVNMDNAPVFDHPDLFNPAHIKLTDIDGSGSTDIIYLGKNNITVWFNQQGNGFTTTPKVIKTLPELNQQTKIAIADLLGTGLSCIVWSNALPKNQGSSLRYIDLMNSEKPHIMSSYKNNLGKEVELFYKPSTHYYIEDKIAGTPWVTKLHFPVQCVAKVVTYDRIMKTRFASEYSYHHGYYDHYEKEFRGFGRVDQKDTEDIEHFIKASGGASNNIVDAALHQDPVLTKTWFHTGAFTDKHKILNQFAHEYFQNTEVAEKILPEPVLPAGLTTEEWRQALRSCKGTMLRKEVYALDDSPLANIPYTAEQHTMLIKSLQPAGQQKYAVYLTHESESITYHYERNAADPRVAQNFVMEIDAYGNVLKSASVVYKRNEPLPGNPSNEAEQEQMHITYNEAAYTNDIQQNFDYRAPASFWNKSYDLKGYPAFTGYLSADNLLTLCTTAATIDYEASFTGPLQKRLIEFVRHQYRADDGITALPFGTVDSKGLAHQSYKAVFNKNMLAATFGSKISAAVLDTILLDPAKGGYVFADNYYWISSGMQQYDTAHFYLITAVTDPFGNTSAVEYDTNYFLFVKKSTDAVNNTIQVKTLPSGKFAFNYRTLMPYIIVDMNDNETAVRFDELGMAIKTFIIGKKGVDEGDEIDENKVETKGAVDHPTAVIEYNLHSWYNQQQAPGFDISNYKPNPSFVKTRGRETHYHADPAHQTEWSEVYSYSDGNGHEILKKEQAAQSRWVGNGRSILNNKGNAVKTYEPYFSTLPAYDDEKEMVELGVTPVTEYDPLDRAIKTTYPDKTFSRVTFTAWKEVHHDANDTVTDSEWYIERGSPDPLAAEPANPTTRAAWLSAKHDDTPETKHLDTLGRIFLTIADNKTETLSSRAIFDIEGNEIETRDALNRVVVSYSFNMLGKQIKQTSMDAGTRWNIADAKGNPLLGWDEKNRELHFAYDALRRPLQSSVKIGAATPFAYSKTVYGEGITSDKTKNIRGTVYKQYDQHSVTTNNAYNFKGKPLSVSKQFTTDYTNDTDWTDTAAITMEVEIFTSSTKYDANNRPIEVVTPHTPAMQPNTILMGYDVGGHLSVVDAKIRGAAATPIVTDIQYSAKGQRESITYGNNTTTKYKYDPYTQCLLQLLTTRNAGADILQDLNYYYDAAGNLVQMQDNAQATVFFDGEQVQPINKYEYDAIYRLKKATGRKHAGQTDIQSKTNLQHGSNFSKHPFINSKTISANDAGAFRNYTELYSYDVVDNMLSQQHIAKNSNWTRTFEYDNGNNLNNHLTKTSVGGDDYHYNYDAHGNMMGLETVLNEVWDFMDQFRQADLGGGGTVYYVYDSSGQRSRKIIERTDGSVKERYYLGGFEIYREKNNTGNIILERETLHVMDDQKRIGMIDTPTIKPVTNNETQLIRYHYNNHIGSTGLELDDAAKIISYEEFFPFGSCSFHTIDATREISVNRYRYTGKERDEETGLNYHGARYYAPWLCRWTKADPIGIKDGLNIYVYAGNRPVSSNDPTGLWEWPSARTVAIVAAVVVVAVVVTVATAGVGTAAVGAAVGAAGLTGTAATAATAVGTVAVAAGSGALGSMAATTTSVGLTEGRMPTRSELRDSAASGAVAGVVTLGVGTALSAGARGAVGAARAATVAGTASRATRAVAAVGTASRSSSAAGTAIRATARAARGTVSGAAGGASYEATRQQVSGERAARGGFDTDRIRDAAVVGGISGGIGDAVAGPALQRAGTRLFEGGYVRGISIRSLPVRGRGLSWLSSQTGNPYLIGEHGTVSGRRIVTVATPAGPRAFYARTGGGGANSGGAQPGQWAPFDGFSEGAPHLGYPRGWFVKDQYSAGMTEANPLFRFGTEENLATSRWLGEQNLSTGPRRPHAAVQTELEQAGVPVRDPFAGFNNNNN